MTHTTEGPADWFATAEVAAVSGYSIQQVRDLERLGVIPPAHRAANGYRDFSPIHVTALRAYRSLASAVGPVEARRALREIHALPLDRAVALISSFHVALVRGRDDALAAQRALDVIRGEAAAEADPIADDAMTITELASALGVRTSTLRFWEHVGLVTPERVTRLNARRYPPPAVREARITAVLRAAGYRIPDIQNLMRSIRVVKDLDGPYEALQDRLDTIARQMLALIAAGADIVAILNAS